MPPLDIFFAADLPYFDTDTAMPLDFDAAACFSPFTRHAMPLLRCCCHARFRLMLMLLSRHADLRRHTRCHAAITPRHGIAACYADVITPA